MGCFLSYFEPWLLKAGRQPCEVGVTGEPAGARDEGSRCFSQGGEGGTGVGEEKGQEEGARRTEPAEASVCAGAGSLQGGAASAGGSAGSLCPASLVLLAGPWPSLRTPGPASTTTGCLVLLGGGTGGPGGWASWAQGGPLFPRELCVHLGGQSLMGQEGESLGLFLMGTGDPGVDRELLVMKGVPSPGSELLQKGGWGRRKRGRGFLEAPGPSCMGLS